MIRSLLIANRGEIARRIMRTARAMGIRTVAVHSDVDAGMPFVREADEAVCIGGAPARDSYLRQDRILDAARQTGAEAIHPGYGFLSENAGFAEAVQAAGLVWVGAPPAAIRAMGLKDAAKALMIAAGVPVTPGYLGEDQSSERLRAEADTIGYPVLIKAVAGGGGKGMRRVEASSDFAELLDSCRREAASSFGDDRVLIEKYILSPRHIEVQVFGDSHGQVVHLFERDCSLQRRHQKVIEEAPAPGMDEATRRSICDAAVKAAKAVDYVGAGTIEFIADASDGLRADRIWFMEMNTRLQVEHPVTEAITGQDLVEWQLRVASGEPLPKRQDELTIDGWAIEARLYAENPATGFLPSTGKLTYFSIPSHLRQPVRIESGVEAGSEVSPFYDPMLAKLIVHRLGRREAAAALAERCASVVCWPVYTNAGFLVRTLEHRQFISGKVDTGFIERNVEELVPSNIPTDEALQSAAMLVLDGFRGGSADATWNLGTTGVSQELGPWTQLDGFRANAAPSPTIVPLNDGKQTFEVAVGSWNPPRTAEIVAEGILAEDRGSAFMLTAGPLADGGGGASASDGAILAPMPGRIVSVAVAAGASVAAGQRLVVLEAMKMEQALVAPFDGVVAELNAQEGDQVSEGTLLARIEKAQD